jgi:uncharacterized protein YggE
MTIGGAMKIAAVAALAVAALVLASWGGADDTEVAAAGGLAGNELSAETAPLPARPGASPAGITVTGTGTADAVPDVAEWSFGVQSDGTTASDALAANSSAMERVLAALRDADLGKDDLRTEHVSVYPRMSDDGRSIAGYTASNAVHATVRGLERAGEVVDAAVAAGANEVYGPSLRLSDSEAQYRAAIDAAFDDARARAESIARKAGVTLGAPVAIVEGGGTPVPYYERAVAEAAGGAGVPIEPGEQEVAATLTVTFAIS